ncbi:DMT family transporter [Leisingera sp. M527]|uniref:DMT family transporter n=1 Tax=Leisingera sp. M527 TaxID=2867014 RepID=UPI0021A7E5DA|nr:DMT family transporter [Leisingera sp. M527]UWQ33029.1 DMT family transporter [Leisingera sp. M527]
MTNNSSIAAHLFLVFACLAWGGSYAVGRFGLSEGSALWLTLWRWGPGAVLFAAYLILKWDQHGSIIRANLPRLTLISALGVVVYPATLFMAVAQTTALNASLYLSVAPVLIVLISSFVWKERVGLVGAAAVLFGLLGALVLVFRGSLEALFAFQIASSDIWAIVSALAWAGYCVSLPLKPAGLSEVSFLGVLVVIGSLVLAALAVASGGIVPMPDTPLVAWSMVYFALFPSILAFLAWNWGTRRVGPSIAAPYNNLVPFFGGALGVLLLGERIETYHLWGGSFVVLGLVLNSMRR